MEYNTLSSTSIPICTHFILTQIPPIPRNIEQMEQLAKLISFLYHQILNFPKLTLLHKTFKIANLAIADYVVLNRTNIELFAANT